MTLSEQQQLFDDNIRLAVVTAKKAAKKYSKKYYHQYLQSALVGLWKAVQSYDPEKGQLHTIAYLRMHGEIIDEYRRSMFFCDRHRESPEMIQALEDVEIDAVGEVLSSDLGKDPMQLCIRQDALEKVYSTVSKEDRDIILGMVEGKSMVEIGKSRGVSGSRISQKVTKMLSSITRNSPQAGR